MTVHLTHEIEQVKKSVLGQSAVVEQALARAIQAVVQRDASLAQQVIDDDRGIDLQEIEIEEECLKILALHQPVASDLRFIVAVLKMNGELERIADLAGSISLHAQHLAKLEVPVPPFDLGAMSATVRRMLKETLDALVSLDASLAGKVIAADRTVDEMLSRMYRQSLDCDFSTPERIDCIQRHISIARSLERIADHATNVAEDVIYLVKGNIVRHASRAIPPQPETLPAGGGGAGPAAHRGPTQY